VPFPAEHVFRRLQQKCHEANDETYKAALFQVNCMRWRSYADCPAERTIEGIRNRVDFRQKETE